MLETGSPPATLAPMLASSGGLPVDEERWAFEPKWDGMRAVVHLGGRSSAAPGVVVRSRNLRDVTASFPELATMATALNGVVAVLDGELVALDDAGRPSFQRLQERMHRARPGAQLVADVPVTYVVFDLLWLGDQPLVGLTFEERRAVLVDLDLGGPCWRTGPSFVGAGSATLESARAHGMEGVVAKRLASVYQPGRRSRDWVKVKLLERCELVVGGWMPGEGGRAGAIGSLLLGAYDDRGALRFVGSAGSGLTGGDLSWFAERLAGIARSDSPFADPVGRRDARFVEPELVVEVEYRQRTTDGLLRQPVYKGLRLDKDPGDVTLADVC